MGRPRYMARSLLPCRQAEAPLFRVAGASGDEIGTSIFSRNTAEQRDQYGKLHSSGMLFLSTRWPQKGKVVGLGLHGKGKIFELLFSRFPTLAIKQCIGHKSQCWKPRCYPRLLSKLQLRKPEINVWTPILSLWIKISAFSNILSLGS